MKSNMPKDQAMRHPDGLVLEPRLVADPARFDALLDTVWDWSVARYADEQLMRSLLEAQDTAGLDVMAALLFAWADKSGLDCMAIDYFYPLITRRRAVLAAVRARRRLAKGTDAYEGLKKSELKEERQSLRVYLRLFCLLARRAGAKALLDKYIDHLEVVGEPRNALSAVRQLLSSAG